MVFPQPDMSVGVVLVGGKVQQRSSVFKNGKDRRTCRTYPQARDQGGINLFDRLSDRLFKAEAVIIQMMADHEGV